MTDFSTSRAAARRAAVEREILDAAWSLMERQGAAALSVREVARVVGMRQQSLTHYFPSKPALLDALFTDGFTDLRGVLAALPPRADAVEGAAAVASAVVEYCVAHPARYQLMLQRSVPGFSPSAASLAVTADVLGVLVGALAAAGMTDDADVALVRSLISGAAAEQIANDPAGRQFVDQVGRGVRALVAAAAGRPPRQRGGRR